MGKAGKSCNLHVTVSPARALVPSAVAGAGARTTGCVDLYGLDVLISDALQPAILEVNLAPDMGTTKTRTHRQVG